MPFIDIFIFFFVVRTEKQKYNLLSIKDKTSSSGGAVRQST